MFIFVFSGKVILSIVNGFEFKFKFVKSVTRLLLLLFSCSEFKFLELLVLPILISFELKFELVFEFSLVGIVTLVLLLLSFELY